MEIKFGYVVNASLEEAQQVAIVEDTNSQGSFNAVLEGDTLAIQGSYGNLTSDLSVVGNEDSEGNNPSAIHVHIGDTGVNGNIIRNLRVMDDGDGSGRFIGRFELNESEIETAFDNGLYINLHTEDNPSGELRGQIELKEEGKIPLDPRSVQNKDMGGIDLRNLDTDKFVEVEFKITREADFNNVSDFYVVDDEGKAIDPLSGNSVAPGEDGYLEAALNSRLGFDFSVDDDGEMTVTKTMPGGFNYAPMVVVNGTFDQLTDDNPDNDPEVYFPYQAANSDGVEHIKSMNDEGLFGFEDLPGGGDEDFNDITFQASEVI